MKEHLSFVEDLCQLDSLAGNKFYTTLDLGSGCGQIPKSENSKRLAAFVAPNGHFAFTGMSFGLVYAPSTFQKTINNILGNAS